MNFTDQEWTLIGKAELSDQPEDKKTIIQLVAEKGNLDMFKFCEEKFSDFVDKSFLEELVQALCTVYILCRNFSLFI